jgi:hypothetical protein
LFQPYDNLTIVILESCTLLLLCSLYIYIILSSGIKNNITFDVPDSAAYFEYVKQIKRCSVVCITTGYWLDDRGLEFESQ